MGIRKHYFGTTMILELIKDWIKDTFPEAKCVQIFGVDPPYLYFKFDDIDIQHPQRFAIEYREPEFKLYAFFRYIIDLKLNPEDPQFFDKLQIAINDHRNESKDNERRFEIWGDEKTGYTYF